MAKIPFSKLGVKVNSDVVVLPYNEYNIEVRKYLPMEEKTTLVSNVLNLSSDENGYYNPMRVKMFLTLETVYAYTNLTFTTKMKEDIFKLYDTLVSSGLFADIVNCIPVNEWENLQETVWNTISNIYEYKNSVMGILDTISADYSNLSLDATEIQKNIADPENLELVRSILTKLG